MKEVQLKRFAGPYTKPHLPPENVVQSPLGLVPKSGNKTRLIFHLSYDFGVEECDWSVNHFTPEDLCSVKYADLDRAIHYCINLMKQVTSINEQLCFGKTDFSSAFRILPVLVSQRWLLVMMAEHPKSKTQFYFIDLCLPFGLSRSCALFQDFSDTMKNITQVKMSQTLKAPIVIPNYLDDFLFIALLRRVCNAMVKQFLVIITLVGCPVSQEKTEYASPLMIFLGILLDGQNQLLIIPTDKRVKALNLLNWVIQKKKVTVKFIQQLTGTLNFLNKAVVPGRAFTRGMYAALKLVDKSGRKLKPYHHVWLDNNLSLTVWCGKNFSQMTIISICAILLWTSPQEAVPPSS